MLDAAIGDVTEKLTEGFELISSLGGIAMAPDTHVATGPSVFDQELRRLEEESERNAREWFEFEGRIIRDAANMGQSGGRSLADTGEEDIVGISEAESAAFDGIVAAYEGTGAADGATSQDSASSQE